MSDLSPLRRLLRAAVALLALVVIGLSGFHWIEGLSPVDALYMAVITISTVGFGEVKPLSPAGRLFTVVLIISSGGLAAYSLGVIAEYVLAGQWREHWEERQRARMLANLKNHVIVCGYGRVGRHVSIDLKAEGMPFVVIESDPVKVEHIRRNGDLVIQGNAANELRLLEAGIERARALVSVASSDAENVFIVLTARSLNDRLLIIARANFEESEPKLLKAGANRVLLPYRISGRRMVTMIARPAVADFLDEVMHASGLEFILEQVTVAPDSPLVGKTLAEAQLRNLIGVSVVACRTGDEALQVSPATVLRPATQIIALGTRDQIQDLINLAQGRATRDSQALRPSAFSNQ